MSTSSRIIAAACAIALPPHLQQASGTVYAVCR